MSLKKALSALALGLAFVSSASANTLTYQGVTFNTWAIDADSMGLSILNAPSATGNWTGASFLKAFEVKGIGDITGASISPSQFAVTADHGLSANIGCSTGGTPGACFSASTPDFADLQHDLDDRLHRHESQFQRAAPQRFSFSPT